MKKEQIEAVLALLNPEAYPEAEAVTELLARLEIRGTVQVVPVTGDMGKSTVTEALASILVQADYTTASYVWHGGALPLAGRLLCSGQPFASAAFCKAAEKVLRQVDSSFSRLAAEAVIALLLAEQAGCRFLVLELPEPALAAALPAVAAVGICAIAPDDERKPNPTAAAHYTQALRAGCPAVVMPGMESECLGEVLAAAAQVDCPVTAPSMEDLTVEPKGKVDYGGYAVRLQNRGLPAAKAAAMAAELAFALWRGGVEIPDESILAGLEVANGPFCFSRMEYPGRVYLDGAHTPAQCAELARTVGAEGWNKVCCILSVDDTADVEALCTALETGSWESADKADKTKLGGMGETPFDTLYTVAHSGSNGMDAKAARTAAKYHFDAMYAMDLEDALEAAAEDEADCVVICGSHTIVADAICLADRLAAEEAAGDGKKEK